MRVMDEIGISEFKARCIALLKQVQETRTPLVVTHRGQPLVRIEPLGSGEPRRLGALRNTGRICGDLVDFRWDQEWQMEQA